MLKTSLLMQNNYIVQFIIVFPNSHRLVFSLGYAFCTFENHDVALKCLRVLNNHPSIFSKEKRPIVEFAVENAKAVKLLADRRKDFP